MPIESTATLSPIKRLLLFVDDSLLVGFGEVTSVLLSPINERERAFVDAFVDFDDLGTGGTFSDIVFLFLKSAAEGCLPSLLEGVGILAILDVGNLDIENKKEKPISA